MTVSEDHADRSSNVEADALSAAVAPWLRANRVTVDDRRLQNTVWSFLRVRIKTIGGGTSELQPTILGERLLGLPKEPEFDRHLAWKDVRRS